MGNLRQRALDIAIAEINKKTDLLRRNRIVGCPVFPWFCLPSDCDRDLPVCGYYNFDNATLPLDANRRCPSTLARWD
jgi:hypothetical protein